MLQAPTEAEARAQLATLPHACGDTTFAPPMTRSHDEHGLWLVFRGPCPGCREHRELRFHAREPHGTGEPVSAAGANSSGDHTIHRACAVCHGTGEYSRVTGDDAIATLPCEVCSGSGRVSSTLH